MSSVAKTLSARAPLTSFGRMKSGVHQRFDELMRGNEHVVIAASTTSSSPWSTGLKGLGDAITTTFPQTTVQTRIVHLICSSLDYASWKELKAIATALRPIYATATLEAARTLNRIESSRTLIRSSESVDSDTRAQR
jgi:hypothetical protein